MQPNPALSNLNEMLASLDPLLDSEEFVFCTMPIHEMANYAGLRPFATIAEQEGLTLVVRRSGADAHKLSYDSRFQRITLQVHSSLDAVGLTAAVSSELTRVGICANIIAGYFHDHIFVAADRANEAMNCLNALSARYQT
jgi:hypothetical protein